MNFDMFQLSCRESNNLLERVKNEAGVAWRKDADEFILTGMFDQVQSALKYLQEYFGRRPYLQFAQEEKPYSKDTSSRPGSKAFTGKNIEDITRWREDMNFMFDWQEQHLTSERSERVRYCSCHENIKFISSSQRVMFF